MLLSMGLALGYCCRINLSICIVAMTSKEGSNGYPVRHAARQAARARAAATPVLEYSTVPPEQ